MFGFLHSKNFTLTNLQLEGAKAATLASNASVNVLQTQVQALQSEVVSAFEAMEALRASHFTSASETALAASVEHEALLKAQADFKVIAEEIEVLKKLHSEAQQVAEGKLAELESKSAELDSLQAQVVTLKAVKEEGAGRLSELEVEILELKETQEKLDDEREQLQTRSQALENHLSKALAAAEKSTEDNKAREIEFASQIEQLRQQHDIEVNAASDRHSAILASLDALKVELDTASEVNEQAKKDLQAAEQDHAGKLEEAALIHGKNRAELAAEIERITAELKVFQVSFCPDIF